MTNKKRAMVNVKRSSRAQCSRTNCSYNESPTYLTPPIPPQVPKPPRPATQAVRGGGAGTVAEKAQNARFSSSPWKWSRKNFDLTGWAAVHLGLRGLGKCQARLPVPTRGRVGGGGGCDERQGKRREGKENFNVPSTTRSARCVENFSIL